MAVLQLIGQAPEGLPLQAIARQSGLKPPTAHKILRTLVRDGFVQKAARPTRYRLGPSLFDMLLRQWGQSLLQEAPQVLRRLSEKLPTATLTVTQFIGSEFAPVLRLSPERQGFLERPVGNHWPPYTSASALLFQAFWSAEEREAYRSRYPFEEYGRHVWESLDKLEAYLQAVREKGFSAPNLRPGHVIVAVPVFDKGGTLRAACGARQPWDAPANEERVAAALLDAAETLGQVPGATVCAEGNAP